MIFLMLNVITVSAQTQPNPTSGCLNLSGKMVTCEPYIQIVSSDVSMSNGAYTGTITLAGPVPKNSSTYLEWDIAIDSDMNPNTAGVCTGGTCSTAVSNLIFNGIGVDFLIVYNLWNNPCDNGANANDNTPCTFIYVNYNMAYSLPTPAKVSGNTIQFSWKPSEVYGIGMALGPSFNFVVLAGIYSSNGNTFGELQSFDKVPNAGYYEFQSGNVTAVPELTALPIVAFIAIFMSLCVLNYHKKFRATKLR